MRTARAVGAILGILLIDPSPASAADPPGQIAAIGPAGGLSIVAPDGTVRRQFDPATSLRSAAWSPASELGAGAFSWPTWSRDGRRLAAFHGTSETGRSVQVFDAVTGRIEAVTRDPTLRPIYAHWLPDGETLGLLLQEPTGLVLARWRTGQPAPTPLARGAPLFFDFASGSPNEATLHVGRDPSHQGKNTVSRLDLATGRHTVVSAVGGFFGPAAFSRDGRRFVFAEAIGSPPTAARIRVARTEGGDPRTVAERPTHVSLQWGSEGTSLAVASVSDPEAGAFDTLEVLSVEDGSRRLVVEGPIHAYFWSPEGSKILVARPQERGDWRWSVVTLASGGERALTPFLPSPALFQVGRYFDQYALSHPLWSPDGSAFVFAGASEEDPEPVDAVRNPRIYVVPADGSSPARAIAEGHVAFWSPR